MTVVDRWVRRRRSWTAFGHGLASSSQLGSILLVGLLQVIEMQRNEPKKPQVCWFLAVLVGLGEPGDIPGLGHHADELLAHMGCSKVHRVILQFGISHFHDVLDLVFLGGLGNAQLAEPVGQLVELILRHD